jgi:transcription elongation factor SPT5
MAKSFAMHQPTGVLSAFERDSIPGSIYIEARTPKDVHDILQGIGQVIYTQNTPRMDLVLIHDRIPILQMANTKDLVTVKSMSWVRIKKGGEYRNDLSLVESVDLQSSTAHVLLIRRIRPESHRKSNRKRKRMAMFAPDGQLVELEFALADISNSDVNPTQEELQMFERSRDAFVNKALHAGAPSFNLHDRVQVTGGSFVGMEGYVTEIHDDETITVQPSDPQRPAFDLPAFELAKKFNLGDFVQIVHGRNAGGEGFITKVDDGLVIVYTPQDNREVRPVYHQAQTLIVYSVKQAFSKSIGVPPMKKFGKPSHMSSPVHR